MTSFVDPVVIAQINAAKDDLVTEIAKVKPCVDVICTYAGSLPNPIIPEAPIDSIVYGRQNGTWVETGAGTGGVWGQITGNLADQLDLTAKFNTKADSTAISTAGYSGKYEDLTGLPNVLGEAPQDGQQYARYNADWKVVEFTLPANPTVQGSITIKGAADSQAEIILTDPTIDGDWGWTSTHTGGFGTDYSFRTDENGVYHKKDTKTERRLAFFDELPSPSAGTNISTSTTATSVSVNSNTGNDGVINGATTSKAGVLTASDKSKLDGIATGAQVNTFNFADAPSDTKQYARQDGAWAEVVGGGGGGGTVGVDYTAPILNFTTNISSNIIGGLYKPSAGTVANWKNKQVYYKPTATSQYGGAYALVMESNAIQSWAVGDEMVIHMKIGEAWNKSPPAGKHAAYQFHTIAPTSGGSPLYSGLVQIDYDKSIAYKINKLAATTISFTLRVVKGGSSKNLVLTNIQVN